MNWNEFLTEFVLRATNNPGVYQHYGLNQIVEAARKAWDAIQNAELPESEKAKLMTKPTTGFYLRCNPINDEALIELADKAMYVSHQAATWLVIDSAGEICAYEHHPCQAAGRSWYIETIAPSSDFSTTMYEIQEILKLLNTSGQ